MFRLLCVSILFLVVASAQPLSCEEDIHCLEGYYCATQVNVCQECLRCQNFKRDQPIPDISNTCVKSISSCGSCTKGFININKNGVKGNCVLPEFFEFKSGSHYAYLWMTAAAMGLLLVAFVAAIVYVIKYTDVFQIVAYRRLALGASSQAEASVPAAVSSPRHFLKYFLLFYKNPDNKFNEND